MAAVVGTLLCNTRKRREYKERKTYIHLTPREFRERYRFSETGVNYICNEIKDIIKNDTERSHALSVKEKVLITLRYFASGSYMQAVGDTLGRDKGTVSRAVEQVTDALCAIKDSHIKWPDNEMQSVSKSAFYRVAGFPNVIACVDVTHIRLLKPGADRERPFINRKRYPSINVMGVVDHRGIHLYASFHQSKLINKKNADSL